MIGAARWIDPHEYQGGVRLFRPPERRRLSYIFERDRSDSIRDRILPFSPRSCNPQIRLLSTGSSLVKGANLEILDGYDLCEFVNRNSEPLERAIRNEMGHGDGENLRCRSGVIAACWSKIDFESDDGKMETEMSQTLIKVEEERIRMADEILTLMQTWHIDMSRFARVHHVFANALVIHLAKMAQSSWDPQLYLRTMCGPKFR